MDSACLGGGAARFFGTERAADYTPAPTEEYGAPEHPAPLAAVFFLDREKGGRGQSVPEAIPVAPRHAFVRVLVQAGCFTLQDAERKELMMRHYLELSASAPFFTLRVPAGFTRMSEVLDRIEETLQS